MIVLVTGGARSGKSRIAEARALELGALEWGPLGLGAAHSPRPTYIATAEPFDDEMRARIALHRARRGAEPSVPHPARPGRDLLERQRRGARLRGRASPTP
jgi:adenosylcobinamide kinase/adenosylcobinamide-phosphate guanylyltransferase